MEYLIQKETLDSIGNAVRSATGNTGLIPVSNLASKIAEIDSLNFRVLHGSSQPSSPKANDIWIKSGTAVNGYRFCSNTPSGTNTNTGNVYIVSETSSDRTTNNTVPVLNILDKKENGQTIRCLLNLTGCYQVVNGEWVSMDAYLYKGGAWLQFSSAFTALYIIKDGNVDVDKYPYQYTQKYWDSSSTSEKTRTGGVDSKYIKFEQEYDEKLAVWTEATNGYYQKNEFSNVVVPQSASVFYFQYYRLPVYKNATIQVGSASVSVARDGAPTSSLYNETVSIDVTYEDDKTLKDILFSREAWEAYKDAAIGGGLLGGISSGYKTVDSASRGYDYASDMSKTEKAVVDAVYKARLADEKGKLNNHEKNNLYAQVIEDMEKGIITTDEIESVLGGDSYKNYRATVESENALINEHKTLGNKKGATPAENQRYNELSQKIKAIDPGKRIQLANQVHKETFELVKDTRLAESYHEKGRRSQAFQADVSQYTEKQRGTIQKAIDSGILNNTRRTHDFVDFIARVSAEKGIDFDFTNNEKLKASGFAVDGKFVNGYVQNGVVTINTQSSKSSNTIVGHEITHVLEGTELYDALRNAVYAYAEGKGVNLTARKKAIVKAYGGTKGADINSELTAELVGEYLFSDRDFINRLSAENRTLFDKVFDEIKYLFRVATAGSKEKRQLEKVMKVFEDAYREGGKAKDTPMKQEVQHSLSNDSAYMGNAINMNESLGIVEDSVLLEAKAVRERVAERMNEIKDKGLVGLPDDIEGNTYIANSSYDGTEENTTICPRSLASEAFTDAVSEYLGRPLTVEEQIYISQDLQGRTLTPECIYCYVATDRKAYRAFLGEYINQRDAVLEKLKANPNADVSKNGELYKEFLNGRKDTKPMYSRFKMWVDAYKNGTPMVQASHLANINKLMGDINSEFGAELKAQITDAMKYAQSASWAKKRVGYVAYNGHILKWKQGRIDKLNSHYGLRMYSFSDFHPAFVLENMQMITDASVRGLKMLGYTKDTDFVEIFAPTGMNINISTFGFESGGNVFENNLTGAAWDKAKALRDQYPNVGITFVATNDTLVNWALDQDWIDVVIPYHLVRTGEAVAKAMKYTNYTSESADTKTKEWTKGKDKKYIAPTEHNNDKATYLAAIAENHLKPRFERFIDNPNYMKLVNECRQPASKSQAVQPIFNEEAANTALAKLEANGYYQPIGGSVDRMYEIAGEVAEAMTQDIAPTRYSLSDAVGSDDIAPVAKSDVKYSLGYHAGDLGKSESLAMQTGGRDTGHYGTGTYFVGDEAEISYDSYGKRPHEKVDFNKYNLFKPKTSENARLLHGFLKGVNSYYDRDPSLVSTDAEVDAIKDQFDDLDWDDDTEALYTAINLVSRVVGRYGVSRELQKHLPDTWLSDDGTLSLDNGDDLTTLEVIEMLDNKDRTAYDLERMLDDSWIRRRIWSFEDWNNSVKDVASLLGVSESRVRKIISDIQTEIREANYDYDSMKTADSASTRFMKALGYEGIDVRGIRGYDNTTYGSVIYDLKGEDAKRKAEIGTAKYSLLVEDSDGNKSSVDPANTTREDSLNYMVLSRKGRLNQNTYFPVSPHTSDTIIATLSNAGIDISDKPLAMQAKKARQSQLDGQHIERDGTVVRHHALTPDEILEVIEKLDDSFAAIHQKDRVKTKIEDGKKIYLPAPDNFVFFVTLDSGKECVAVIEFDSYIDERFIQKDGHGDEYHTTVTVFEPDQYRDGEEFDYLEHLALLQSNEELDIKKESPKTKTAIRQTQATVSESEPSRNILPDIAPYVKQNSLADDDDIAPVFRQNSLSELDEDIAPVGNYHVYGKDILLEKKSVPYADFVNSAIQQLANADSDTSTIHGYTIHRTDDGDGYSYRIETPHGTVIEGHSEYDKEAFYSQVVDEISQDIMTRGTMNIAPPFADGDIAPVGNRTPEADEMPSIKKREKVESFKSRKRNDLWEAVKEHLGDNGMIFEDLAFASGNRGVDAKWNFIRNASSAAQHLIGNGDKANGVMSLKAIVDRANKAGKGDAFDKYLKHMHNIDRMSLADRFPGSYNKPVLGDGVTADISMAEVEKLLKANPEFVGWARNVYNFNDHLRDMLVKAGVITQEVADKWAEMYPHYVPIYRTDAEGNIINESKHLGVNAPVKRATGGNGKPMNILEAMATRTEQTYRAIAKNNFGIELMNTLGSVIEHSDSNANEFMESLDMDDMLGQNDGKPTYTVYQNGQRVTFEITKQMYEAMKPQNPVWQKKVPVLSHINSIFRGLTTQYNPLFALTNPIKDIQGVLTNSQHPGKTYLTIPKAIGEMISNGKYYQEYLKNGGKANTYFDKESGFKEDPKLKRFLDTVFAGNDYIEMTPRLAEYIASREAGRGIEESMLDAARVTTNFAAGGDVTKFFNRNGCTFLNASVQGAIQEARNIREAHHKGFMGYVGLATRWAIGGLAPVLLNNLMWEDDEEYEDLADYVKQDYYIVGKYDDGKFIRIPKGRTLAVLQNAMEMVMDFATGDDEVDMARFLELGSLALANLAPNNPFDNNIIAPIRQVSQNRTWYGEDLVPSRLQNLPAEEQYDEKIDFLSKRLGETFGWSPYKINYLLNQYGGGLADFVLPMMTPRAESGDDSFWGEILAPFRDKFTTDAVLNSQTVTDFYDTQDELEIRANSRDATDLDRFRYMYMRSIGYETSDLYAQKREIQNSDLPDSVKYMRVREIQAQINALMEEGLGNYNNARVDGLYAEAGDRRYNFDAESGNWYEIKPLKADGTENWYYQMEQKVTQGLGISYSEYWNNRDMYNFAYEKPGEYAVATACGGYESYMVHHDAFYNIKADKDEYGNSISGSRKRKILAYINGLDIEYGMKLILFKSQYNADDSYNYDIVEYLNSRDDISYQEMEAILKELGFDVDAEGNISW